MQQVEYLMERRQEVVELLFEELGDNVGGGGRSVEGSVSMKEFFGDFLEIMLEAEKEM